jgi:hypothetical protein
VLAGLKPLLGITSDIVSTMLQASDAASMYNTHAKGAIFKQYQASFAIVPTKSSKASEPAAARQVSTWAAKMETILHETAVSDHFTILTYSTKTGDMYTSRITSKQHTVKMMVQRTSKQMHFPWPHSMHQNG